MDKIGVYCSSNKPSLWMPLYEMLSNNKTEIEIMFVGDVVPSFDLPHNVKFLYSTVKPAQCYYIAASRVSGNYLFNVPDDCSYSAGCLDSMLTLIKSQDQSKTIVTPRYRRHPQDFWGNGSTNVTLPVGSLCSRQVWERYGIDRNFICLYWDVDIAMMLRSDGGKTIICEQASMVDDRCLERSTWNSFGRHDITYFYKMWTQNGEIVDNRKMPLNKITDTPDLMSVSQGEKGRWA